MKNTWRTIAVVHVSQHLQWSGEKFHMDSTAAVARVTLGQHQFSCFLKRQRTMATILLLKTRHTITILYVNLNSIVNQLVVVVVVERE